MAMAMTILAITPLLVQSAALTLPEPGHSSKTWFREKYVQQTYDDYYHYTLTRYEFGDNDRDVCRISTSRHPSLQSPDDRYTK